MQTLKCLTAIACGVFFATAVVAQENVSELARQLESSDVQARIDACQELARLGPKAEAAVSQLVAAVESSHPQLQRNAALALAELGTAAAPAVTALAANLSNTDADVRAYSAYALGSIGPAARGATRALIKAMNDQDPVVRRVVRNALYQIKPEPAVAIPLFANLLASDEPAEVASAVEVLVEAGVAAVPVLIHALQDEQAAYGACLALAEIGAPAAPAVKALTKSLDSETPEVRMEALAALAAIGQSSESLAAKICSMLDEDAAEAVRYEAAYALGVLGDQTVALPTLSKALDSEDEFLRVTAAWAYLRLTDNAQSPGLDQAVKTVIDGLSSASLPVRAMAIRACADPDVPIGRLDDMLPRALAGCDDPEQKAAILDALATLGPKVIPLCLASLNGPGPQRLIALELLTKLGPEAAPAIAAICAVLDDTDPQLRQESLYTLGAIGPGAAAVVEKVIARLTDENGDVRAAACYALGKIGPAAATALPQLRTLMDSNDEFLRLAAVWASLKIVPDDQELKRKAVPYLIRGLTDEREHVRIESAYLLGELGDVAHSAIEALRQALQDASEDVRTAAATALEMLE